MSCTTASADTLNTEALEDSMVNQFNNRVLTFENYGASIVQWFPAWRRHFPMIIQQQLAPEPESLDPVPFVRALIDNTAGNVLGIMSWRDSTWTQPQTTELSDRIKDYNRGYNPPNCDVWGIRRVDSRDSDPEHAPSPEALLNEVKLVCPWRLGNAPLTFCEWGSAPIKSMRDREVRR